MNYKQLSPGIRGMVRWLREAWGYETVDSGDGSNWAAGQEGAMPIPMVAIQLKTWSFMTTAADVLLTRLVWAKIKDVHVEACYDTDTRIALLIVSGEGLRDFRGEPRAKILPGSST